jgi:S1-C subfamily serine protease
MVRVGNGILAAAVAAGLAVAVTAAEQEKPEKPEKGVSVVRVRSGGRLGIVVGDVGKDDLGRLKLTEERGALVKEVRKDTPADRAGLKEGDVILRYRGENVWSATQLIRLVRETPAERAVVLDVSRDGAPQKVTVTLESDRTESVFEGALPDFDIPMPPMPPRPPMLDREGLRGFVFGEMGGRLRLPRRLGIEYQEVSGQLARYFKAEGEHAVLVTSVDDNGPAAQAGVKAGDLIVKIDGQAVRDADDLRKAVVRADAGQEVTLTVQREGRPMDLKVKLEGTPARRTRGRTT